MNNQIDIISADELYDDLEQDISNNKYKTAAQFLLEAINDWPTPNVSEPKDFLPDLTDKIGSLLTVDRIEKYSKALNLNNLWKVEATSMLVKVFDYDKTKTLEDIILDITEYYKSK